MQSSPLRCIEAGDDFFSLHFLLAPSAREHPNDWPHKAFGCCSINHLIMLYLRGGLNTCWTICPSNCQNATKKKKHLKKIEKVLSPIFVKLENTTKNRLRTHHPAFMHPSGIHAQHTLKNSNDPHGSEVLRLRADLKYNQIRNGIVLWKNSYFSRDLFHQQFQGNIFLRVGLTSRVHSKVVFGVYCNMDVNGKHWPIVKEQNSSIFWTSNNVCWTLRPFQVIWAVIKNPGWCCF